MGCENFAVRRGAGFDMGMAGLTTEDTEDTEGTEENPTLRNPRRVGHPAEIRPKIKSEVKASTGKPSHHPLRNFEVLPSVAVRLESIVAQELRRRPLDGLTIQWPERCCGTVQPGILSESRERVFAKQRIAAPPRGNHLKNDVADCERANIQLETTEYIAWGAPNQAINSSRSLSASRGDPHLNSTRYSKSAGKLVPLAARKKRRPILPHVINHNGSFKGKSGK